LLENLFTFIFMFMALYYTTVFKKIKPEMGLTPQDRTLPTERAGLPAERAGRDFRRVTNPLKFHLFNIIFDSILLQSRNVRAY